MFKLLEAFKKDDWMYIKAEEHQEICKELSEEIHYLEEELEKIHWYWDKLSNLIKHEIEYLCDELKIEENSEEYFKLFGRFIYAINHLEFVDNEGRLDTKRFQKQWDTFFNI